MSQNHFEHLLQDEEFRRQLAVESLVLDAAERISAAMNSQGITKAELARRLGKSRAWVTQMLNGSANLTLRTLAEVFFALGTDVRLAMPSDIHTPLSPASPHGRPLVKFNGRILEDNPQNLYSAPEEPAA